MRGNTVARILVALGSFSLTACSLVTNFDGYGRADGGGRTDGGDGGGRIDSGPASDGGTDGGPNQCLPACGDTGECIDGECRCGAGVPCSTGQHCCADNCIDVSSDVENCSECGMVCPMGQRSVRTCGGGTCGFDCDDGFADCTGPTDGCETDLSTLANCGGCGNGCMAGQVCNMNAAGAFECASACSAGLTLCSGS